MRFSRLLCWIGSPDNSNDTWICSARGRSWWRRTSPTRIRPGYRTQDIDFQAEFQQRGRERPHAIEVQGLRVKNDGNNVSLDRESRLLAENALRFQMASSLMRSQIQMVRSAIEEGKSA